MAAVEKAIVKRTLKLAGLLSCLLMAFWTRAQSYIEAVNEQSMNGIYYQGVIGYQNNSTIGWTFSPSENILVSSLGWFGDQNPSSGITIGLWNETGTLLSSAMINDNSEMIDGNKFEAINPIQLSANQTYVIGAGISGQMTYLGFFGSPTTNAISYITANLSQGSGFTFPTTLTDSDGYIPAVTFIFQIVPEPNVLALSALGGMFVVWRSRHWYSKPKS